MKLDSKKCAFFSLNKRVSGFMINERRIDAKPKKIEAKLEMQSPKYYRGSPKIDRMYGILGETYFKFSLEVSFLLQVTRIDQRL